MVVTSIKVPVFLRTKLQNTCKRLGFDGVSPCIRALISTLIATLDNDLDAIDVLAAELAIYRSIDKDAVTRAVAKFIAYNEIANEVMQTAEELASTLIDEVDNLLQLGVNHSKIYAYVLNTLRSDYDDGEAGAAEV